jgi:hypothetical protein
MLRSASFCLEAPHKATEPWNGAQASLWCLASCRKSWPQAMPLLTPCCPECLCGACMCPWEMSFSSVHRQADTFGTSTSLPLIVHAWLCAMLCAYHHARAHCPAHMLMRKQVNSHREGEQTVEWSVSCQDSRFLVGEAHCAFESMAAVAAAQLAGALLSC